MSPSWFGASWSVLTSCFGTAQTGGVAIAAGGGIEPPLDGVADGNGNVVVPAAQLPEPIQPGQHVQLRLVSTPSTLFGVLPGLPELSWEDFQEASRAAQADVEASVDRS